MRVIKIGAKLGDVQLVEVENDLKALQELVGGYIQAAAPFGIRHHRCEMLCDEDGLLKGLEPNENLYPFFYVGTCVVLGVNGSEFVGLTDLQIGIVADYLKHLDNGHLYELNF